MALIEFKNIVKRYPGSSTAAIEELNLEIEAGEFLTLLGPSGSGKTTTLMLLAGFEAPTSGQILLDGKAIESLPPHQRNMGVVFQSYSLFPHMTVAQNVAFPLSVRKVPAAEIDQRVKQALAKVQLADYANRKPVQLSGGQQQRVALARALVFEPKLVLMDEPLSALDKKLREEMQLEIRRLHRELGVTMVFVTHDQSEAMTLSDRIVVFNKGRISQLGSPTELYHQPSNPFVASFLGDNNLTTGTVVAQNHNSVEIKTAQGFNLFARPAIGAQMNTGSVSTVCVRPEFLRLVESSTNNTTVSSSANVNRLNATVQDIIHQGDHARLLLQLPQLGNSSTESVQWLAKLPGSLIPAGLAIGQNLFIEFNALDTWVFQG